jgi:hypothetical protein
MELIRSDERDKLIGSLKHNIKTRPSEEGLSNKENTLEMHTSQHIIIALDI